MLGTEDSTAEATYEAVGRALSRWEAVEASFADFYAYFLGRPMSLSPIAAFWDMERTFARRMDAMQRAAAQYFARWCDQEHEGALASLVTRALTQAKDRARIAHGLVQLVEIASYQNDGLPSSVTGYLLSPPWYAMKMLDQTAEDGLGSLDIDRVSMGFVDLKRDALTLLNQLISWHSSRRT